MTDALRASYYCAAEVVRSRRRVGAPIPAWLARHFAQLDAQIRVGVSESGHESPCDRAESNSWLTAREAADLLGLSKRQTQRLAADLDAEMVGGRWLFQAANVISYKEARND